MQRATVVRKDQRSKMGALGPIWWHPRGKEMIVMSCGSRIEIESSAAKLTIEPTKNEREWLVSWRIRQSAVMFDECSVIMDYYTLRAAFDEHPDVHKPSDWLLEQFGGDCARQGKFIRWGNYLNIPGPGTGHDGDRNISIYLDASVRSAVRTFALGINQFKFVDDPAQK